MKKKQKEFICEGCGKVTSEFEYTLNYRRCDQCLQVVDEGIFDEDSMAHASTFGQEEWNEWGQQ
jgi:hypothetical protein